MTQDQPSRLNRIEVTQAVHSQILNELATAHRELAEFSTRQAQRQQQHLDRHDEALSRLENSVSRHDEALTRIEEQTRQNARAIEALTTSTTETIQLVAQQAVQSERDRQTWQAEIRRIWEHLERQTGNGNGRGEQ
jgi:rubrerythrin